MKLAIVLSHLMDVNGNLNDESKARADLTIKLFSRENLDLVLTIGWPYRTDSDLPIALAYRDYLISNGIKKKFIKSDINSRDTVGDAIFSKINLIDKLDFTQVFVITSDYHTERTKEIFGAILPTKIKVIGCDTTMDNDSALKEKDSLSSFHKTFAKTNFKSNNSLLDTLRNKHPFYNGEIYKKMKSQPLELL